MGNYSNIKEIIQSAVYENTTGAVTGSSLQSLLTDIINSVGLNSNFMGFLSSGNKPSASVDGKQFYIGCNESTTPLSIDLTAVGIGMLAIQKENLFIVYSGDSGWQYKDIAVGITSIIPTEVKDLSDGSNYDTKPVYEKFEGDVSIVKLNSNHVYDVSFCTSLSIEAFDYDITDNRSVLLPQTIVIIDAIGDFNIAVNGLKTLNGSQLSCEAGNTYLLTIKGGFAKFELYS